MRTQAMLSTLLLLTAVSACEHRRKDASPPSTPPAATVPRPDPAPAAQVRPPTAADLVTYAKTIPGDGNLTATIETTMGTFHCDLYADKAPITVANFVGLATGQKAWLDPTSRKVQVGKPYYDGLSFHRVIPSFMIQGGDPLGQGTGGPGYEFVNETSPDLPHLAGSLSMANAGPDTNGSQFFVMEAARKQLDGGYSVFGRCAEADLVAKITAVQRNAQDKPLEPVLMTKVTIGRSTTPVAPGAN